MSALDYGFVVIIALIGLAALLSHHKVQILAHVTDLVNTLHPPRNPTPIPTVPPPVPAPTPTPVPAPPSPPNPIPPPTTQPGPMSPFPPGTVVSPAPVLQPPVQQQPTLSPIPPQVNCLMAVSGQPYPVGTGDNTYLVPVVAGEKVLISSAEFYDPVGGSISDGSGKLIASCAMGPKLYLFFEAPTADTYRLTVTTPTMNPSAHVMRQGG